MASTGPWRLLNGPVLEDHAPSPTQGEYDTSLTTHVSVGQDEVRVSVRVRVGMGIGVGVGAGVGVAQGKMHRFFCTGT